MESEHFKNSHAIFFYNCREGLLARSPTAESLLCFLPLRALSPSLPLQLSKRIDRSVRTQSKHTTHLGEVCVGGKEGVGGGVAEGRKKGDFRKLKVGKSSSESREVFFALLAFFFFSSPHSSSTHSFHFFFFSLSPFFSLFRSKKKHLFSAKRNEPRGPGPLREARGRAQGPGRAGPGEGVRAEQAGAQDGGQGRFWFWFWFVFFFENERSLMTTCSCRPHLCPLKGFFFASITSQAYLTSC